MKVEIIGSTVRVTREPSDPKFKDGSWGDAESRLLYHVKRILNARGMDLIKKRMWRDGHMVDDRQQYLRSRLKNAKCICIRNLSWQIAGADKDFNERGVVDLYMESLAQ
jgi:hypothetical protein